MSSNGVIKSQILAPDGLQVPSATWEAPKGSSPFFGWMGQDGLSSVRIESVQAIFPNAQRSGLYTLVLQYGVQMGINSEDAFRLMRRLGWSQPGATPRA